MGVVVTFKGMNILSAGGIPEAESAKSRELVLPDRYRKMRSLPGDPPDAVAYEYKTSGAECFVSCRPIRLSAAMPFGRPLEVIYGMRPVMTDSQGLVEVETGRTRNGYRYTYVITKYRTGFAGVKYDLHLHLDFVDSVMELQGYFNETGKFGFRENTVHSRIFGGEKSARYLKALGLWEADPYEPWLSEGFLMNGSEYEVYDEEFPEHPLSELRRLIKEIIRLN